MVHEEDSYGKKLKPRGKPFQKGHRGGSLEKNLLAATGPKISDSRADIEPDEKEVLVSITKHDFNELKPVDVKEKITAVKEEDELIDSIEFKHGENNLTIKFTKKSNRMFRLQVFLNDKIEVRPVTYTGSSTGYSFWNLLKGSLK